MRPLLFSSGNYSSYLLACIPILSFNEAAALQQRKFLRTRTKVPRTSARASMRPLLFSSGNSMKALIIALTYPASMRPLLFSSGNPVLLLLGHVRG